MEGFKTFTVTVREYDLSTDDGTHVFTEREAKEMFRPFVVQAYDDIDAMNKVSNRVGWNIMDCDIQVG